MKVLKATDKQYNDLNGYTNGNNILVFINSNIGWIVGMQILEDEAFSEIKDKLLELGEVEYIIETEE